jgi:hypothetical protein
MTDQLTDAVARSGEGDLTALLNSGETWVSSPSGGAPA